MNLNYIQFMYRCQYIDLFRLSIIVYLAEWKQQVYFEDWDLHKFTYKASMLTKLGD